MSDTDPRGWPLRYWQPGSPHHRGVRRVPGASRCRRGGVVEAPWTHPSVKEGWGEGAKTARPLFTNECLSDMATQFFGPPPTNMRAQILAKKSVLGPPLRQRRTMI